MVKEYVQFFTPIDLVNETLDIINNIKPIQGNVLEPSFGDGNFINGLSKYNIELDAVEIDKKYYKTFNNVSTFNIDFLDYKTNKKYDFIIGNPPYIELCYSFYNKEKQDLIKQEYNISNGRLNLVHIFLKKCFNLLNEDGILAFLLPSAVLTSPIYKILRKEIYEQYTIKYLNENVNFKGVAISVCLLVIQKRKDNNDYFYVNGDSYFITKNYKEFSNKKTLKDEGFDVNIGEIVWNQKKDILTENNTVNTLIYSSNIKYNSLDLTPTRNRKQYIDYPVKHNNCIVFPRTISKKIKFYYVKNNENLVFENHVLVLIGNPVKLEQFYLKLLNGDYDQLLLSFFNSSNLSKSELLSLPFI